MELDGRHDFDAIVVGPANRLAVAAALAVAENPGATYNPLYIWGEPGLGKSHLLAAIGLRAQRLHPALQIVALTLEELVQQLRSSVSMGDAESFLRRFEDTGVLLIDDVQLVAGRWDVQAELLRLCEGFHAVGRQIVFAGDRPPGEITDAGEQLVAELSGGLVVDIGTPATNGHGPRASGSVQAPPAAEFLNFLSDVATVVARHVEPWRAAIGEAAERWAAEGYDTAVLQRAMRAQADPGSAALVAMFERCVARLRTLECEAAAIDAGLATMAVFRNPARVAAAEDVVARAREQQALADATVEVTDPSVDLAEAPVELIESNEPADDTPAVSVIARRTSRGMVITSIVADDPFFLDEEKVVWEWPDALGRVIEEFR